MVRVVFIHPDLGIGGAERLIVDCSLALQVKGHTTTIVTAHHDRSHAFTETISGEVEVVCVGDWLPRALMGRCQALCASLRMVYVTLYVMLVLQADVVIVDQARRVRFDFSCDSNVRTCCSRCPHLFRCYEPQVSPQYSTVTIQIFFSQPRGHGSSQYTALHWTGWRRSLQGRRLWFSSTVCLPGECSERHSPDLVMYLHKYYIRVLPCTCLMAKVPNHLKSKMIQTSPHSCQSTDMKERKILD